MKHLMTTPQEKVEVGAEIDILHSPDTPLDSSVPRPF